MSNEKHDKPAKKSVKFVDDLNEKFDIDKRNIANEEREAIERTLQAKEDFRSLFEQIQRKPEPGTEIKQEQDAQLWNIFKSLLNLKGTLELATEETKNQFAEIIKEVRTPWNKTQGKETDSIREDRIIAIYNHIYSFEKSVEKQESAAPEISPETVARRAKLQRGNTVITPKAAEPKGLSAAQLEEKKIIGEIIETKLQETTRLTSGLGKIKIDAEKAKAPVNPQPTPAEKAERAKIMDDILGGEAKTRQTNSLEKMYEKANAKTQANKQQTNVAQQAATKPQSLSAENAEFLDQVAKQQSEQKQGRFLNKLQSHVAKQPKQPETTKPNKEAFAILDGLKAGQDKRRQESSFDKVSKSTAAKHQAQAKEPRESGTFQIESRSKLESLKAFVKEGFKNLNRIAQGYSKEEKAIKEKIELIQGLVQQYGKDLTTTVSNATSLQGGSLSQAEIQDFVAQGKLIQELYQEVKREPEPSDVIQKSVKKLETAINTNSVVKAALLGTQPVTAEKVTEAIQRVYRTVKFESNAPDKMPEAPSIGLSQHK